MNIENVSCVFQTLINEGLSQREIGILFIGVAIGMVISGATIIVASLLTFAQS
jgi:tetrahydromethanopterin S-methyltransferase subunit G